MKIYKLIDFLQRKINSILFRLTIVAYAWLIIFIYSNPFNWYTYFFITLIYIFLYSKLLKRPILRLINDFLFLTTILYTHNPSSIVFYIFLCLPVINSINFSGEKKSVLLYIFTISCYISLVYIHDGKINTNHFVNLLPIAALWFINTYSHLRNKLALFREDLYDRIDAAHLNQQYLTKPHRLYQLMTQTINEHIKSQSIEDIYCINVRNSKAIVISGSTFVWKFKILSESIFESIEKKTLLLNEKVAINNKLSKKNIIIFSSVHEEQYIYLITYNHNLPLYYIAIGFFMTLKPSLDKISGILLINRELQEISSKEMIKIAERRQYVNAANKTMHFIRNRLGPFSNLIKILQTFDTVPSEKKESLTSILADERGRAEIELEGIINRADKILEKSKNPFIYNSLDSISLQKIYTILSRNFTSFFPDKEVEVKVLPKDEKKYISINSEGFELFLSDWLNNMTKYSKNTVSCIFNVSENSLVITFLNDHDLTREDVGRMINDLNSDDRSEIMKRTTHGLHFIKSTLEEMNILFLASSDDSTNLISLELTLNIS